MPNRSNSKTSILVVVVLLVISALNKYYIRQKDAETTPWKYEPNNPKEWVKEYPTCDGKLQSPINIETSKAYENSNLRPIHLNSYDKTYLFKLVNANQTVLVSPVLNSSSDYAPYITGSDFGLDVYKLQQFHFHWGKNPKQGSEHTIDGKYFAGELHLVHKSNSGKFAVLGFLLEITKEDNSNLDDLLNAMQANAEQNSITTAHLNLKQTFPNFYRKLTQYYRYIGSLTQPPCTEGIIWNVFRETIKISAKQMKAFYANNVKFNVRKVKELNSRVVFASP